ncbi:HipA N-terminal domain-containing protein [Pantoea cypripedii]|uniref:HipA N-terminal domain-containing protein n=1 Tax=Pantoea cypripedii TaxID=55209 RepID=UPI001FC986E2|nr:HipA N-terminal domain-containing protein [Pantoea cypripedii]
MISEQSPQQAFVWIWLPGETSPVVSGRLSNDNAGNLVFNYGRSYLERIRDQPAAIPIYLPELPLQSGVLPLLPGLTMPSAIRDSAPDAWGRRVIINRKLGVRGADTDTALLDELTYLLESGSDRIGALDFQRSATDYEPRSAKKC